MKIVFTGGGTGGHFYPIIAVAEKINQIIDKENIVGAKLYFLSDEPYDKEMLAENEIIFEKTTAGKLRTYFSFKNFTDIIKTFFGFINAFYKLFSIYPDVVFGKGGYASFPTLLSAFFLRIPVVIHESDSAPGRVNLWAGKFARKIAVSYKEAATYFPLDKVAWTGQPIRMEIEYPASKKEALDYFKLEESTPTILILGGSQGSEPINNLILDALPRLIKKYQILHQTGFNNFQNVSERAKVILAKEKNTERYRAIPFLSRLAVKMASGASNLVISRAGSSIFEIASWGIPSIIIPITESVNNHQIKNAFSYAHTGACVVVEEENMTANILCSEIERIFGNKEIWENMAKNTKFYHKTGASEKIARVIVDIALSHEK